MGQYITSGTLQYGRWDNSVCLGPGVNASTPAIAPIYNLPPSCFHGTSDCAIGTVYLNATFGDPFPGVSKHVRSIKPILFY